jgi:hypothetical protein
MTPIPPAKLDRRKFLRRCGQWSVGALLAAAGYQMGQAGPDGEPFVAPPYPRPPLDGACLQPVTDVEKVLAAVVDTVVPGADTDPNGDPGALEACALNLMFDEYYPFKGYADLIATVMNQAAQNSFQTDFLSATYEQRLEVLVEAQEALPVLRLAYRAIRSAFYGGAYNGIGLTFVHYPGPNLGYRHLPEFSSGTAISTEASATGWLP